MPIILSSRSMPPPTGPTGGGGGGDYMKWNPGHGWRTNSQPYVENLSSLLSEIGTVYSDIGSNAVFYSYAAPWGDCETTKDDYSDGDALIDAVLDECIAKGYRLVIHCKTRKFGGLSVPSTPQANQRAVPDYLIDEGKVFICSDGGGEGAALHQSYVMDRCLAWIGHMAARYNDHPWVEGFIFGETSYNMSNDTSNWSEANYVTQFNRLCDYLPTVWTHTWASPGINYFWGRTQTETYTQRNIDLGNAMAVPDVMTNDEIPTGSGWTEATSWGINNSYGYEWDGDSYELTGTDRHLEVPFTGEMQVIVRTGLTIAEYLDHITDNVQPTHMCWTRYTTGTTYFTSVTCEWDYPTLGLKAMFNGGPPTLRTAYPTKFTDLGKTQVTGGT